MVWPPGLNIHALRPEARLGGGNLHGHRAGDVEADKLVAGGGVGHVHGLAVHLDGESRGVHFLRNGNGLHARGGLSRNGKREKDHEH
jgi:hypothetical protein